MNFELFVMILIKQKAPVINQLIKLTKKKKVNK